MQGYETGFYDWHPPDAGNGWCHEDEWMGDYGSRSPYGESYDPCAAEFIEPCNACGDWGHYSNTCSSISPPFQFAEPCSNCGYWSHQSDTCEMAPLPSIIPNTLPPIRLSPRLREYDLEDEDYDILPIFQGIPGEDAFSFIKSYEDTTRRFPLQGLTADEVKMRLFSYTLKNQAKTWLKNLKPDSLTTWDDVYVRFLEFFAPPDPDEFRYRVQNQEVEVVRNQEDILENWEQLDRMEVMMGNIAAALEKLGTASENSSPTLIQETIPSLIPLQPDQIAEVPILHSVEPILEEDEEEQLGYINLPSLDVLEPESVICGESLSALMEEVFEGEKIVVDEEDLEVAPISLALFEDSLGISVGWFPLNIPESDEGLGLISLIEDVKEMSSTLGDIEGIEEMLEEKIDLPPVFSDITIHDPGSEVMFEKKIDSPLVCPYMCLSDVERVDIIVEDLEGNADSFFSDLFPVVDFSRFRPPKRVVESNLLITFLTLHAGLGDYHHTFLLMENTKAWHDRHLFLDPG